jgi:hypothetical protein
MTTITWVLTLGSALLYVFIIRDIVLEVRGK